MIENLADDKKLVDKALEFIDIYDNVSDDRGAIESRWLQHWNMWKVYKDIYYYSGTSNIYLPIVRKNTEDGINNVTAKLFPTDDFINVRAMPGTPDRFADALKALLLFQLTEEIKLPLNIKSFLRELFVIGTCVGKLSFDSLNRCPQVECLDLKEDFYLYPTTVDDVDKAMVTFERMRVDRYELERMAELGKYLNIKYLPEEGSTEDKRPRKDPLNQEHEKYKQLPVYDLVESYAILDFGGKKGNQPVVMTFDPTQRKVLQITPSPYKFKTPSKERTYFKPYVSHSLIKRPKQFYGPSIFEVSERLQYAMNDTANLVMDNGILIQNPIVKVDTARVQNLASLVFQPRARWDCEPDAVVFDRPPDVLSSGLALLQQMKFWTEENSNIGGMTPMTTKRVTATEIATFNQLMGTFIASTVADTETGLTLPIAKKVFYLDQLYLKAEDIRRILGIQGFYIQLGKEGKSIVKKDYMFRWLGSTQSMNIHIKSQQCINFIGVCAAIPPQVQQGFTVNFPYLLREAWRNLGHTDVDKVVTEFDKQLEVDIREENEMLANGKEISVHPKDDDISHMLGHDLDSKKHMDDEAIYRGYTEHIGKHLEQAKAKFEMQQQMVQQQAMQMAGMIPPGQGGGGAPKTTGGAPGGQMAQPPRVTQASTVGDVAAQNLGGGPPKPPITNPIQELRA